MGETTKDIQGWAKGQILMLGWTWLCHFFRVFQKLPLVEAGILKQFYKNTWKKREESN